MRSTCQNLAMLGVLANLFPGLLAGYAFARLRFLGREVLFRIKLAFLLVPGIVTLIPTFILGSLPLAGGNAVLGTRRLRSAQSLLGRDAVRGAGRFRGLLHASVLLYFTLKDDLLDAGRADSASGFRIFWRLYLPLCTPALATLPIFTFQAGWNLFL